MPDLAVVVGLRGRWRWAGRLVVAALVLTGLGALAVYALPWLDHRVTDWYEALTDSGPVGFGLPMLVALLAVVLIIGQRSRRD